MFLCGFSACECAEDEIPNMLVAICIKIDGFCIEIDELCTKMDGFCIKIDELCTKDDDLCIKIDELCITNDGVCIKIHDFNANVKVDVDDVGCTLGKSCYGCSKMKVIFMLENDEFRLNDVEFQLKDDEF